MGHGSPRSLSSRRWWTRTFRPGDGGVTLAEPVPYGAATSVDSLGVVDIFVDRPSLEASPRSPGRGADVPQSVTRPCGAPNLVRRASHRRAQGGEPIRLPVDDRGQPTPVHWRPVKVMKDVRPRKATMGIPASRRAPAWKARAAGAAATIVQLAAVFSVVELVTDGPRGR